MAHQVAVAMKNVPGLRQCNFFADDEVGAYGTITYWDSQAEMEAGNQATGPAIYETIGAHVAPTVSVRVFEEYVPATV